MIGRTECTRQCVRMLSRRSFLKGAACGAAAVTALGCDALADAEKGPEESKVDFPLVDYHVHLSRALTIEKAVELANKRGVKFGIVEHPGPGYKIVDDKALKQYLEMLEKHPVYKGLQPVYPDWSKGLSKELLCQLDYILMDALTLPEKNRGWLRIWRADTVVTDKQAFMERYLDFNLQILTQEPIDIFAWPTYLPTAISQEYDVLWTQARMQKLVDVAVKKGVAFEINELAKVPKMRFIMMAKEAGTKFTFGTDSRDERAGLFEYCLQIVNHCGLSNKDMFSPKPDGKKAIQKSQKQ
jgi:histidinol phosphatase-like PHP family hydrolase